MQDWLERGQRRSLDAYIYVIFENMHSRSSEIRDPLMSHESSHAGMSTKELMSSGRSVLILSFHGLRQQNAICSLQDSSAYLLT